MLQSADSKTGRFNCSSQNVRITDITRSVSEYRVKSAVGSRYLHLTLSGYALRTKYPSKEDCIDTCSRSSLSNFVSIAHVAVPRIVS